jgi:catechol 2,3-dioxygenase-like lactoylglutathione lyase family enzyme
MITGVHLVSFSPDADADRKFLGDVLGWSSIDAGGGWPIFALPPTEIAAHPDDGRGFGFFLMCDDLDAEIAQLKAHGVTCDPVREERWGTVTAFTLPSGQPIGLYRPKHPSPHS